MSGQSSGTLPRFLKAPRGISRSSEPINPKNAIAAACTAFFAACPRGAAPGWCRTAGARDATASPRSGRRLQLKKRFVYSGRTLVAFAIPVETEESRIGVTVSRHVKGAVDRNRARRRLREAARERMLGPDSPLSRVGIRYDVVLIARPAALDLPFADLEAETEQAALRLANLNS
ncbi:MAG: ribonuclease P protein component [Chloroflexi bacterium]|nr:MAG: ribonuclease P protein component [Chloroflexota bacterium]